LLLLSHPALGNIHFHVRMTHHKNSPSEMKKILVFVVRHGEREDEVQGLSTYMSKEDRVDPKLTPEGHQQAAMAFESLLSALTFARVKNVAVFTSPLRRAIGTVIMISAAASKFQYGGEVGLELEETNVRRGQTINDYGGIHFVLPTARIEHEHDNNKKSGCDAGFRVNDVTSCIPIVVHNGLCDCTALVSQMGGNEKFIEAGLSCVAIPENNSIDHHINYVIREKLEDIKVNTFENKNNSYGSGGIIPSVQFWMIRKGGPTSAPTDTFVPMAEPLNLAYDKQIEKVQHNDCLSTKPGSPCHIEYENESPIDQVVRMAIDADCDACIVSSHREEIRELYKHKCGYRFKKMAIPYCCIGMFEVLSDNTNNPLSPHDRSTRTLQWILHDVVAPEELPHDSIHNIQSYNQQTPCKTSPKPFSITYPVIERTTLDLCVARLIADDLAAENSVVSIESLCLTGAEANRKNKETGFELNLEVINGHHSWLTFLRQLQDDTGHGFVELSIMGNQNNEPTRHRALVAVRPSRQDLLPCPPKTIGIEIML
jgi:hypothetical protein